MPTIFPSILGSIFLNLLNSPDTFPISLVGCYSNVNWFFSPFLL